MSHFVGLASRWFFKNFRNTVFIATGFLSLIQAYLFLANGRVSEGFILGAFGLMLLFLADSTLKRIRLPGVELETWERQQQRADQLIARLEKIVELYSNQLIIQKVEQGRWQDGPDWSGTAHLLAELADQHSALDLNINMGLGRTRAQALMIFDIYQSNHELLDGPLREIRAVAAKLVGERYPGADYSNTAFAAEMALTSMPKRVEQPFELAKQRRLGAALLQEYKETADIMSTHFSLDFRPPSRVIELLERLKDLEGREHFEMTPELVKLAGGD